jgi:hypothetical protein
MEYVAMHARSFFLGLVLLVSIAALALQKTASSQQQTAEPPAQAAPSAPDANDDLPPVPKGVEVLARGPVHEAFATPTTEPVPTKPVAKEPPKPLEEMPPAEKPEGNVVWIGGYWAWDDERNDYLWVSGTWRTPPPGKQWVAGYWKEDGGQWRWVPGFWTVVAEQQETASQQVTYLPEPPAPPEVAAPGQPPTADSFYVPGYWGYHGAGYVQVNGSNVYREAGYSWVSGYWARVQPGYVWVPAHYRWTPGGYLFVAGYWDLSVTQRGMLYAPIYVDAALVGPTFVYTPAYAVHETLLVDAMFVRPSYCHYYFGDYYGPVYRSYGFESCIVYSQRRYDAIFVYERYEHRNEPAWERTQINIFIGRDRGVAPLPPRTLVQQNTIIQQNVTNVTNINNANVVNNNTTNINRTAVTNNQMLMPSSKLAAAKGVRTVPLDAGTRVQARQQAQAIQQVALQRNQAEVPTAPGRPIQPRSATLNVPTAQPVSSRLAAASGQRPAQAASTSAGAAATAKSAYPNNSAPGTNPSTATKLGPPPGPGAKPMPGGRSTQPMTGSSANQRTTPARTAPSLLQKVMPRPSPNQKKQDPPAKRPPSNDTHAP